MVENVAKGQKITAAQQNQIIDAVNSLYSNYNSYNNNLKASNNLKDFEPYLFQCHIDSAPFMTNYDQDLSIHNEVIFINLGTDTEKLKSSINIDGRTVQDVINIDPYFTSNDVIIDDRWLNPHYLQGNGWKPYGLHYTVVGDGSYGEIHHINLGIYALENKETHSISNYYAVLHSELSNQIEERIDKLLSVTQSDDYIFHRIFDIPLVNDGLPLVVQTLSSDVLSAWNLTQRHLGDLHLTYGGTPFDSEMEYILNERDPQHGKQYYDTHAVGKSLQKTELSGILYDQLYDFTTAASDVIDLSYNTHTFELCAYLSNEPLSQSLELITRAYDLSDKQHLHPYLKYINLGCISNDIPYPMVKSLSYVSLSDGTCQFGEEGLSVVTTELEEGSISDYVSYNVPFPTFIYDIKAIEGYEHHSRETTGLEIYAINTPSPYTIDIYHPDPDLATLSQVLSDYWCEPVLQIVWGDEGHLCYQKLDPYAIEGTRWIDIGGPSSEIAEWLNLFSSKGLAWCRMYDGIEAPCDPVAYNPLLKEVNGYNFKLSIDIEKFPIDVDRGLSLGRFLDNPDTAKLVVTNTMYLSNYEDETFLSVITDEIEGAKNTIVNYKVFVQENPSLYNLYVSNNLCTFEFNVETAINCKSLSAADRIDTDIIAISGYVEKNLEVEMAVHATDISGMNLFADDKVNTNNLSVGGEVQSVLNCKEDVYCDKKIETMQLAASMLQVMGYNFTVETIQIPIVAQDPMGGWKITGVKERRILTNASEGDVQEPSFI